MTTTAPRADLEPPPFADLPTLDGIDVRHAWDVFGPDDELGTLNLITPDVALAGLACARTGERIGLALASDEIDPPLWGRRPAEHHHLEAGAVVDEWLDCYYPQAASQWDGFGHHRSRAGAYGGADSPPSAGRLSIHHWARQGIVTRGVLLDLAAHRPGRDPLVEGTITADEIEEVAHAQDVTPRRGDVLCARTGGGQASRALDHDGRRALADAGTHLTSLGLAADEATAARLWDWQLAAVATDNPAVEQTPGNPAVGSLHRRVLMALGMPLGELFDLDLLAARCADEQRWTFAFAAAPLALVDGVGSPANAVAIL